MINISESQRNRYWAFFYNDDDKQVMRELYEFNPQDLARQNYVNLRYILGAGESILDGEVLINETRDQLVHTPTFKYFDIYQMEQYYPEYLV